MGAFYGSVQLKTEEAPRVRRLVEEFAASGGRRFLLSPGIRGWVGVYESRAGIDPALAEALAARLSCPILHLTVHDDDVFAYRFFNGGRLVDEFNSLPDYFGEIPRKEKARVKGRPEVFRDLLASPGQAAELKRVMASKRVFASENLKGFADLLGIPNVLTSYEYLTQGETEEIEAWDRFSHVPKQKEERPPAKDGRLLFEAHGRPTTGPFSTQPQICPAPESGFFAAWTDLMSRSSSPLEILGPPWRKPAPAGISPGPNVHSMALSPSGRHLAAAVYSDGAKTQLWDLKDKRLLGEFPHPDSVSMVGFSDDGKLLVSRSATRIVLADVGAATAVAGFPTQPAAGHHNAALHPSGAFLVAIEKGNLSLIDTASGASRTLFVGPKRDLGFLRSLFLPQIRKVIQETKEKDIEEKVRKLLGDGAPKVQETTRRFFNELKKVGAADWSGSQVQGSERPAAVRFSPDGELLLCATDRGVRAYRWPEVLAAREELPAPRFSANSQGRFVYSMVCDAAFRRAVFAGAEGIIGWLSLDDGRSGVLLEVPGRPRVLRIALSADAAALAAVCLPTEGGRGGKQTARLQVWDYEALNKKV